MLFFTRFWWSFLVLMVVIFMHLDISIWGWTNGWQQQQQWWSPKPTVQHQNHKSWKIQPCCCCSWDHDHNNDERLVFFALLPAMVERLSAQLAAHKLDTNCDNIIHKRGTNRSDDPWQCCCYQTSLKWHQNPFKTEICVEHFFHRCLSTVFFWHLPTPRSRKSQFRERKCTFN